MTPAEIFEALRTTPEPFATFTAIDDAVAVWVGTPDGEDLMVCVSSLAAVRRVFWRARRRDVLRALDEPKAPGYLRSILILPNGTSCTQDTHPSAPRRVPLTLVHGQKGS